jgi:hypothetical protein
MFWIVMTKDTIYRIPKPQELGILFGSLPERMLEEFFTDNPKALKDFDETMLNLVSPSLVPNIAAPVVEQFFNQSLFTRQKLIPSRLEKLMPEYQYTEYTSETAKQLGKMIAAIPGMRMKSGASPMVIDNYVRGWTGTLGQYALQVADKALYAAGVAPEPVKPTATLADIPVIKAFVIRYPSATAQSIQDFQDKVADLERVQNTIRQLAKNGDVEASQKEALLAQNNGEMISLSGMAESIGAQHKMIRLIYRNPNMKPVEKRQLIDQLYNNMILISRQGNKLAEEVEKMTKGKRK